MTWNHDITAAPRGKTVHSERKVGDRIHQISDFVTDYIWAATQCGKVIKSYWIPPVGKNAGRWSGFANGEQPIAWQHFVVPEHPFQESPRKAAEAVAERPASKGATVASGLVEADKAEAVAGGLGQPELIPALTVQHGGVNVGGPERAGVTGGESAATSFQVSNRANGESGANASKGVTAGETETQFYLEDVGGGA